MSKQYCLFFLILLIHCFSFAQSEKKTLYLIPGQGSDYRIYKYFRFENFDTVHIKYIIPEEDETMQSYAHKLAKQMDTSGRYSIIGVSLGGMLATETADFLHPEEVIIISSAENNTELPLRYKFMKQIPLNDVYSGSFLRYAAPAAQLIVEPDSRNERDLCVSMLKNKNELFMKRSVNMIIHWDRTSSDKNIIHIHGDNDHTIPLRNVKSPDYIVKNGSHMMTLTRGKELKKIVCKYLTE